MGPQHLACGATGIQVEGVHDGETKAARRHGVAFGFLVLVKRDLHAGDARHAPHLGEERRRRMSVAPPMRAEQHYAVSVAAPGVGEVPSPLVIETHERLDPARAIEVGPLVAHAQMRFDDASADRLCVENAGVALEMPANPRSAILLDAAIALGVHRPMVEGAFVSRLAGDVPPPARLAVDDRDVRADMTPVQKRHPHVARREACLIVLLRGKDATRDSHALEVDDRLGKYGKARRLDAMRSGIETLAQRDRDLVIDPAVMRIPKPSVAVFGRDVHIGRTGRTLEILQAPGIGFADWHARSIRLPYDASIIGPGRPEHGPKNSYPSRSKQRRESSPRRAPMS